MNPPRSGMLLTCACRELDIYQRLVMLDTLNHDMFNGNTGIASYGKLFFFHFESGPTVVFVHI